MTRPKLFLFFVFLILISSVSRAELYFHYTLDDSDIVGNVVVDLQGHDNATLNSGTPGETCILDQCIYFDGTDDYIYQFNTPNLGYFTINVWAKPIDDDANSDIIILYENNRLSIRNRGADDDIESLIDSGSGYTKLYSTVDYEGWQMITFIQNESNMYLFTNATLQDSGTNRTSQDINVDDCIGCTYNGGASNHFKGWIDDVRIYTHELESSEIQELFDLRLTEPYLKLESDLINGTENYGETSLTWHYNGTLDNTEDLFNCSIYYQDILNKTTEVNLTVNQEETIDFDLYEGWFNITLNCSNADVSDTEIYYYRIDTIQPNTQMTGFINNSYYDLLDDVNFTYTVNDTNLGYYNRTIFDLNGDIMDSIFIDSITGTGYTDTYTKKQTALGDYSMHFQTWDTHTSNLVKPISKDIQADKIILECLEITGDLDYEKTEFILSEKKDKYNFELAWTDTKSLSQELILENKCENLYYYPESKYKGHFTFNYKRYLDFESDNLKDLSITYIGNNRYRLKFNFLKPEDKTLFNSIGDLNYIEEWYYYTVVDYEETADLTNIESSLSILSGGVQLMAYIFWFIFNTILFLVNKSRDYSIDILGFLSSLVLGIYLAVNFGLISSISFLLCYLFGIRVVADEYKG